MARNRHHSDPAPHGRRRRAVPVRLVATDPALERFGAMARAGAWALGSTLTVATGLAATAQVGSVIGWVLLAGAAAVSSAPVVRHTVRTRRHDGGGLPLWTLDPRWARSVTRAADEAGRLRTLADDAPSGPVADHLTFLAERAEQYVVALHGAATEASALAELDRYPGPGANTPGRRPTTEVERDAAVIVDQLAELVAAAERLRRAQRQHLEPTPLTELIEHTDRIAESIESQADSPPPR